MFVCLHLFVCDNMMENNEKVGNKSIIDCENETIVVNNEDCDSSSFPKRFAIIKFHLNNQLFICSDFTVFVGTLNSTSYR